MFSKVGANLMPWKKERKNNKVLLLLHNFSGYSSITQTIYNQHIECDRVIAKLQDAGYEVIISNHPKMGISPGRPDQIDRVGTFKFMQEALEYVDFAVGWNTNALCHVAIRGVPIVCLHDDCLAYDVASHSIAEPLIRPDRTKWINKLSWTQWTKRELKNGDFWPIINMYISTLQR